MKSKTSAWISAARLRTLPLSVSGIIVGISLAISEGHFNSTIAMLCIATTISYQVLSNFANDYGDGVKGTDNKDRVGPVRALQSGVIGKDEMKRGIYVTVLISFLLTIILIYKAFGSDSLFLTLVFLLLGIVSVIAAIKYTVGGGAYGYRGLGDLFVFVFFGLVSVIGSYFLFTKQWNWLTLFPAISIGMLSVGVLNLNNMRDRESDAKAGKITLVVRIGDEFAKYYHYYIIISAMFFSILYTIFTYNSSVNFLYFLSFVPLVLHLKRVYNTKNSKLLDPELKKLALSTFLFALLFALSINIFL
ncbi:1,4-dihydroxy-2-naphthoate polyprenyltransferase [Ascidiimonas sp. W6]|uniref:1,4-dihydroxy-2-naphthoate polyprenyltransferase n=1 Tax=Ascidiimonas meishanensis TaxID=3128903 RepID=UPI0030EE2CC5